MATKKEEEARLRSAALQTSSSILQTRRRAEEALLQAKAALEEKTAELAHSLSMMRATLESTTDGILVVDQRGDITDFNEQFVKMWQMPIDLVKFGKREPLLRLAAEQLKNPKQFLASTKEIYASSPPESMDVLEFTDGRVFERFSKVQAIEGESVGRVWSYRDVTARKHSEEAARISHARFAAIIDQSPVGIYLVDAGLRLQHVNTKALPTFGNIDNVVGRDLSEILDVLWPEEMAAEVMARFRHTLATGEPYSAKAFRGARQDRDESEYYDWEIHRITLPDGQQGVVCYFIDITAHMEAQEALRRSEEDLRALANSIPQLAWMAAPDGNIFWYNQGWYEYTGTMFEEMQGWGWQSVHDPKMLPLVLERWKASIQSGERFDMEFPLRGADGIFRWFLTRVNPVRDNEGRVVRWFGTNTNVDNVKRAEEALRDEARVLELLNKTGGSIAAKLDLQTIVQTVTDAATELTGAKFGAFFYNIIDENGEAFLLYTLSGAPREAFEKFGHPRATALFGPTFNGHGPIRSDDILKDSRYGQWGPHHGMPKGHLPVRSYLAMPVVSSSGEVIGGLFFGHPETGVFTERAERILVGVAAQAAIAIDNARLYEAAQKELTQRRNTETALRQSEQFNRTIIVSSRDCIKTVSLDGVLLWVSEKGQETLCIKDLEAVIGKSWIDFWSGKDRDAADAAVRAAREGGSGHFVGYFEVEGKPRWWDVVVSPILDASGQPETLLAVSRDVTEGKAAESERERLLVSEKEARERAERETRMKDEFLATLSHELRTPLNAILGWSNIIRTAVDPNEIAEGLEVIERNARSQTQIIEDLLDMSRIISGTVRLDVQRVDMVPVVKAAVESIQPTAAAKEIRLTSVLDPLAGPIAGDPARLQQILWNLLTNALKFTPKKGRVHVLLERVNSHVELSVTDTGEGIAAEFLPHVFDRFRQADASTTRKQRGLGLGLAIVKNLAELHGGSVHAKSAGTGHGSTFTLVLPVSPAHITPQPDRRHPVGGGRAEGADRHPDLTGVRILAVDDEPDSRELVKRILTNCGASVVTAACCGEALALLQAEIPDVLITDIGMPEEDGYALIRKVRQLAPANGGNVPAIALTAFARSEDRRRAILSGFQMHVSKPVEPPELVAMVASLAGRTV